MHDSTGIDVEVENVHIGSMRVLALVKCPKSRVPLVIYDAKSFNV
jgi:hypothetical protein